MSCAGKTVAIIQARLGSSRMPGKVLETVGGIPMVKRVWLAAKASRFIDQVIVAWPERYPDLDENNVLERFRRVALETEAETIVRLTADCPLLTTQDIEEAFDSYFGCYYSNHKDGYDVQIFPISVLMSKRLTNKEHVIADFETKPTGLSVNTKKDLDRVRKLCAGK
jgi:spore coat polysaccharide biosynthesis protein SpsF (cytidylyltransferase family)